MHLLHWNYPSRKAESVNNLIVHWFLVWKLFISEPVVVSFHLNVWPNLLQNFGCNSLFINITNKPIHRWIAYLIFVTSITYICIGWEKLVMSCGEISDFNTWQMWRNLKFLFIFRNFRFFTQHMWRNQKFWEISKFYTWPYLLHDLQTHVDRSKVKKQLTKVGKVNLANNMLLLMHFQLSLSLIKSSLNLFPNAHAMWNHAKNSMKKFKRPTSMI